MYGFYGNNFNFIKKGVIANDIKELKMCYSLTQLSEKC